jgi:endo-1,4-beta-D-glucanase Y
LDCGSPLPLFARRPTFQSARGLAQSKTLTRRSGAPQDGTSFCGQNSPPQKATRVFSLDYFSVRNEVNCLVIGASVSPQRKTRIRIQVTSSLARILGASLLAMSAAVPALAETPARPFPQHTAYAAGSIKPASISQATLDHETAAFYDLWKRKRLIASDSPGQFYVAFDDRDSKAGAEVIAVSEGMGYGMLITAFMAGHDQEAKRYFDGLYRFYKSHPSKNNPHLMAWRQVRGGGNARDDGDSAADADLDIAYALLVAHRQWGSAGEINYLAEGKTMIGSIYSDDINARASTVKLGDDISSDDAAYSDTRSSDLIPDHFRAFQRVTGRAEWSAVLDKSYAIIESLQKRYSPVTGLVPDFIRRADTSPRPANPNYLETRHDGDYYYNACRFPFRIGLDFLLNGEPRSQAALEKLTRWVREETGDDPSKIAAGYSLNGKRLKKGEDDGQMCFVAPLAVAAMAHPESQAWLNALADSIIKPGPDDADYFDGTIKLLCLLVISGNWWSP